MRLIVDVGGTYLRAKLYKKKDLQKSFRVKSKDISLVNYIDGIVKDYKGIKKIALSFAGQVKDGVILASPNIKTDKKDIAKYFKKKYNIDLYIQNDLSCAVLAEAKYFKTQNICAIYVGTGIGCGVVSGGRLIDGYMGVSTELGHIPYKESFFRCGCGKTNCLELFCSGVAIKKMKKHYKLDKDLTLQDLKKQKSIVYKEFEDALVVAVATAITIFNPEIVVLGGGVIESNQKLCDTISKRLKDFAMPIALKGVKIKNSKLKDAPMLGASLLIGR